MRMREILERLVSGDGRPEDLDLLEELGAAITDTALCGLGKSAALPVLSTLKNFRSEYEAHLQKHCPAGSCEKLKSFIIAPDACKGCSKCARNCPVGAISGELKKTYTIDQSVCIKCGACQTACPFQAIYTA